MPRRTDRNVVDAVAIDVAGADHHAAVVFARLPAAPSFR
jgi:hypothetical protein